MDIAFLEVPTILPGGFSVNALYALVGLILAVLTYLALRAPGARSRVAAMVAMCGAYGAVVVAGMEQLSFPKPLAAKWVTAQKGHEIVILSAPIIRRNTGRVELLADIGGASRFFSLALTPELEESLKKALEAWKDGLGGSLRFRIEPTWKKIPPQFHVLPWPAPPPKDAPVPGETHTFRQDA